MNYSPKNNKEKAKANWIYERLYFYFKDANINYMTAKNASIVNWDRYIINNLSFQDYIFNIRLKNLKTSVNDGSTIILFPLSRWADYNQKALNR